MGRRWGGLAIDGRGAAFFVYGAAMNTLYVFLGAGLGGAMRYGVGLAVMRAGWVGSFPLATFLINVSGCFAMGLVVGWLAQRAEGARGLMLFLTTGVLGGFTTFSAFALETVRLQTAGRLDLAALYIAASVVVAVLALVAGLALARLL